VLLVGPQAAERRQAAPPQAPRRGYGRRAFLADALMLAVAMALLSFVSPMDSPSGTIPAEPLGWSLAFSVATIGMFYARGMYATPMRLDVLDTLRSIATGTAVAAMTVITARVLLANDTWVATETVRHWLVAVPVLATGRGAVLWSEARARRFGGAAIPALVVGAGRIGRLTADRLLGDSDLGLRPVAFFDDDPLPGGGGLSDSLPVLDSRDGILQVLADHDIEQVVITFSTASHEEMLGLARTCIAEGVDVSVVPRLFELEGERVETEHLGGLPLVLLRPADPSSARLRVKYALDRILAAAALLLMLPILAVAAVSVLLSMGMPLFYRQRRVGRDGHEFEMLKLRTLRESASGSRDSADAAWAARQIGSDSSAEPDDLSERMTRVGAFLRRYSLDELPQLWNVVRGDMSLVGPRPERVGYVDRFEGNIYRYGERHRMKAGLTGWAQVNGLRGQTPLADRVEWDNHYIENWSPWLDFKILARTVGCVFRGQPTA
jgi:exopolysaccharide biosynthesis polyprenyl glycosylphosphotransferase